MKNLFLHICLLVLLSPVVFAQVSTIESVPNPKVANNTYVSDPDNILNAATRDSINLIFSAVEQMTSDQVTLVVLQSIGEEVPKNFAYKLYNKWGVGVKGKNNGLLILLAMDQRRIEFETGYGMEGILPDATCKRIEMHYMIPRFKENNYDQGLIDGIKATADILMNKENSSYFLDMDAKENLASSSESSYTYSGDTYVDVDSNIAFLIFLGIVWAISVTIAYYVKRARRSFADLYATALPMQKEKVRLVISKRRWFILYGIIPLVFMLSFAFMIESPGYAFSVGLSIYLYLVIVFAEKRYRSNKNYNVITEKSDFYEKYKKYTKVHEYWFWTAVIFPFPFLFYVLYYLKEKNKLRNHPRDCKNCSSPATKLDEKADDTHLSKAQLLEEQLKSIDYDVWYCQSCSSKQVLSYKNVFSKYSECKSCGTRAYYLHSDITLVSATYDSTGTGERTYKCKYCGKSHTETYTIPVKQRSSSSSSSSSSGGGGGGGGSFGGGSSGGGGAGSSW